MTLDRIGQTLPTNYTVCTSSTRPSNPVEGQMIYETDTNLVYYYDSAAWRLNGIQTVGHSAIGGSASSITITLPSITNGLHLFVQTLLQSDTSSNDAGLQPNGDNTSGNYFHQFMYGQNTSIVAAQNANAGARMGIIDNGSTYWGSATAWIYNYAGSGQKNIQSFYASPWSLSTSALTFTNYTIWKSTAAITSVVVRASTGNFRAGSMVTVQVIGSV